MGRKDSDSILRLLIRFSHEIMGLTPNQISTIGLVVGIAAALVVAAGYLLPGMIVMALSQIIDGLDGGVARMYHLQSKRGQRLEVIYDRLSELAMFLALAFAGYCTQGLALLAFAAIVLITVIEPLSRFDPGCKRFMLYFGYILTSVFGVPGFEIALHVVFWANLVGFIIGTILVDYRLQREIDTQAIIRRQRERETGFPLPPDDPPSLLSRLFS